MKEQWNDKIFNVDAAHFEELSLEIFDFQYRHNNVYKAFIDMLRIDASTIKSIFEIPFLPIRLFKTHEVKTTAFEPQARFESSGTSQSIQSHHLVKDLQLYRESFLKAFEWFYGRVDEWCIIGLLPSYLERNNSSLVFMVNELIRRTRHQSSGFYLHEYEMLFQTLKQLEAERQKTLLLGVSFALVDFAENYTLPLKHTIIMETGGMKGRREEMIRHKLHALLKERFQVDCIHSEYGMTELLSQAYSQNDGIFNCPPWMNILIRDEEDPLSLESGVGSSGVFTRPATTISSDRSAAALGAINVIDLANVYSCSFIATDDAGKLLPGGGFEVLGRIDNSDVRGCSLLLL